MNIALKRVEYDIKNEIEFAMQKLNFCFEINDGGDIAFGLTIPM